MFIRVSETRIVPTANIVDILVTPARTARYVSTTESASMVSDSSPLVVEIVTNATVGRFDDGGDHPDLAHVEQMPYAITLHGVEAEKFLAALPVYEPVLDDEQELGPNERAYEDYLANGGHLSYEDWDIERMRIYREAEGGGF